MIESNEATTPAVTVEPNDAVTTALETNVTTDPTVVIAATETNVTTDPEVVTAVTYEGDPVVFSAFATDLPAVVTSDDPQATSSIDVLRSIYQQIDNVKAQLDSLIAQRDELLADRDACSAIKEEINRLLGKLVPYTNGYANFIQSLQNNLNNIELSAKVDPEFFSNLTSFTENYEPNDEEVSKIVSNLGGTASNRAGFSPLAILSSFNAVKNVTKLSSDVGNDYIRNVATVKTSRPVPSAS